jgi:hypothetical protein
MSPKDACGPAGLLRKLLDERAFAGAGFPADERNSSRPPTCVEQVLRQFFELSLAFEQGHGPRSIRQAAPLKKMSTPSARKLGVCRPQFGYFCRFAGAGPSLSCEVTGRPAQNGDFQCHGT